MDRVTRYANEVLAGRIVAGRLVRLACQRHLKDRDEGPNRGLYWDTDALDRHLGFFPDVLRLAEGEHAGKPFNLGLWQAFIQGSLFGWKRVKDDYRRFRTAYIEVGKGNGKSPMAGGTGIYMTCADGEIGAHCYAAATSLEQADILFQDAVNMVGASPALSSRLTLSGKQKVFNIADLSTGSFFRKVSAEHRGLDGKRVHFAALDEIHEHSTSLVVNKISAGKKGRRQPLIYEITNSGYDRHSICWQHHVYSEKVLEGHIPDDEWFAYVCGLDEGDDWKNEKVWLKANPNLGVSIPESYLRGQVAQAIGMPEDENLIKRLNFCIWTEQSERWMPMETWDACKVEESAESLVGQKCYGGLDLALTRDISALVLVFPPQKGRKTWAFLPYFWIPDEDIRIRSHKDRVPYELWKSEGEIFSTPGNIADHDFIEKQISDLRPKYQIMEIAYDRALAAQLVTHLQAEGLTMVPFAQGPYSMNAGVRTIEKLILGKLLANANNKVMRWMASNAVLVGDSNGNVKFDKSRAKEKIDGLVALAMGIARAGLSAQPNMGAPSISVL